MRGYRTAQGKAPLSEVLAAGLLMLAEWDKETDLIDPMCGSGTFLTEAAMIATNTPAGFFRERFGFEKWKSFNSEVWESVKQKAESSMTNMKCSLKGFDKDPRATNAARENIENAGFANDIEISKVAFEHLKPESENALLIINPPYGERMEDPEEVKETYKMIGDQLKNRWQGHTAWILTSNEEALKNVGLRTTKRITVFNGPLECKFQRYEMYSGTKKQRPIDTESEDL
jgi:putative N6-adenine-specific DNA methylase